MIRTLLFAVLVALASGCDSDSPADADTDAVIDGDADADSDGDGDTDSDADCSHDTCNTISYGCTCLWYCDDMPVNIRCDFYESPYMCDCNGDDIMDCELIDVALDETACGDYTCCFQ